MLALGPCAGSLHKQAAVMSSKLIMRHFDSRLSNTLIVVASYCIPSFPLSLFSIPARTRTRVSLAFPVARTSDTMQRFVLSSGGKSEKNSPSFCFAVRHFSYLCRGGGQRPADRSKNVLRV